jgi:hypothetical protein
MLNQYIKYIEDEDLPEDDNGDEELDEIQEVFDICSQIYNETRNLRERLYNQVLKRFEQLCDMRHIDIDSAYRSFVDPIYQGYTEIGDLDLITFILYQSV